MDLGVSEFVTKPVNNHDLLTRVRTQLSNLEWDKANASFRDGMLNIVFPKRDEAKPRRIMIQ